MKGHSSDFLLIYISEALEFRNLVLPTNLARLSVI